MLKTCKFMYFFSFPLLRPYPLNFENNPCLQNILDALFHGARVSVLQNEKSSGDWLHNKANVLNATELYT